jgi:hypothetical protein
LKKNEKIIVTKTVLFDAYVEVFGTSFNFVKRTSKNPKNSSGILKIQKPENQKMIRSDSCMKSFI